MKNRGRRKNVKRNSEMTHGKGKHKDNCQRNVRRKAVKRQEGEVGERRRGRKEYEMRADRDRKMLLMTD